MNRFTLLVALVLLTVCGMLNAQIVPSDAQAFQPTVEMHQWWQAAEAACDCQPAAHFGDIAWYQTPQEFRCTEADTGLCWGYWLKLGVDNYVFLSPAARYTRLEVQHEMLHAIFGDGSHDGRFHRALDRLR